jgi:asparagine synthase (glutamine-hydrolysing)
MCGIAGYLALETTLHLDEARAVAGAMTNALTHRGPDDTGCWVDAAAGIALGHRRLSILDLSPEGRQPMLSASGRYVVAFNGEIYNFQALRAELDKADDGAGLWRGHSDTEVMLAAFECWGVEAALGKFIGMFAFALWDRRDRLLYLGRDRLGEKPLYYGWVHGALTFASELKALRAYPGWRGEIDRDALALFMRHDYIPAPYSIYRDIYKLPPGTLLALSADTARRKRPFSPRPATRADATLCRPLYYWSIKDVAESGTRSSFTVSTDEAVSQLDTLLRTSVAQQMVADVPLGAFLSGGIDSTTVVALMQAQSERPVKTFTIGFNEPGYNEAEHAKAVARHLGTEHTELYVTPDQAQAVIPRLPDLYDEPFADSSQIPTFLVAQLARRHVTVALSGDGGDELFGGYNRYFWGRNLWRRFGWMPRGMRGAAASGMTWLSPQSWDRVFSGLGPLLPSPLRQPQAGSKLHKLAGIIRVRDPEELYLGLVSHWADPAAVVKGAREPPTALSDPDHRVDLADFTDRMMYLDTVTYLPDDILVKVDRAAMGVSLETRVPLLDHRVVEFAWRVPLSMKIRDGQGKWLLRQVLYRYVPQALMERPKMGFGVPIDSWLRGPLREWAEELLGEARLRQEGYFEPAPIRRLWREHLSGERDWQYHLWDVLMFQAWLERSRRQ